jgi:RNA polymerase sigma factor (sigma-70 family)
MSPRISISLLAAQPDQRLLALARDGNERAFEALVHRYRRPLLRYCRRMRLSETRAEDVLQQAFLQAWLALSRGAEVRELRAWLYRIVHNVAVNAMRGTAESHGELTEAVQARAALAGESNLERRIAVREALGEVAELPQMQRAAIFLTAVDGQTHDEVADALGISHGALRGLLYRARATLRGAAAALTPTPLLAWASNGTGAAAPSAERLAELTAGGGAGFAGVLLKGAVVAVTAGALATGAGVVANHERGPAGLPHGAGANLLAAPARTRERRGAAGVGSTVALVEPRSTRTRGGGEARHGKRSTGGRARRGERHGDDSSRDRVARGGREDSAPRNDDGDGQRSPADGNQENAGGADDRGGSSTGSGSTGDSSHGGSSHGGSSHGESSPGDSAGREREQSPSGDRHPGSDGSQGVGGKAGEEVAAEVVEPAALGSAAPEAEQASGGQTSGKQTSGEQTQGGGRGGSTRGSSDTESSRSDG